MTYESVEDALQKASRCLSSPEHDEILRGIGLAIYALARQNVPEPEPRKPTGEQIEKSKERSLI